MTDDSVIYMKRKDVPKNYDPKGFNFTLFGILAAGSYFLFIVFDIFYKTFNNLEESAFNRAYIIAIILLISLILAFIFKADKGDKYYQLHIAPSGIIIKFKRGEKIIPYEDVTNIVIEYDIQTVIKFYKGEEIIKELNHVEFNEKQLLGRLEHFNYPVEVKHLLD